jgi:beta-glucosidase
MKKLFIITLIFFIGCSEKIPPYLDTDLSFEERARDLVERMTVEEKISQTLHDAPAVKRLGIPEYYWMNECLHGVANMEEFATIFPQSIGIGASWDKQTMYKVATAISDEARAMHHNGYLNREGRYLGGLTFFSPNINLFRDPRWGRGQESYSEDPYHIGQMGIQFIKGLQGDDPKYLKLVSTAKHYVVHSGPEPERHVFDAITNERDFWETYMPHFLDAITEAKVYSVMCAYNRYKGESCCGSDYLMNQILRDQYGFEGYIVSDCGSIADIYENHQITETEAEAAALAMNSGVDLNCGFVYHSLDEALGKGLTSKKELDQAVYRLMLARMKLGMFDPPEMVPYSKIPADVIDGSKHKELALDMARKSIVLMKNKSNVLPLDKSIGKIAVIGPNTANETVLLGNYNGMPSDPVSLLSGLKEKLPNTDILYSKGCEYVNAPDLLNLFPSFMLYSDEDFLNKGLTVEYFPNKEFEGTPVMKRTEQIIFLTNEFGVPFKGLEENNFSVRWSGFIMVPETARYQILLEAPETCKVYINDELILDSKTANETGELTLEQGEKYQLQIDLVADSEEFETLMYLKMNAEDLKKNAIQAAGQADAIILAMGISPEIEGEELGVQLPGFAGGDRTTIELPEIQQEIIGEIQKYNKPIIMVLMGGGSFGLEKEDQICDAILEAWYPGQSGGTAIADVLFGDYNPGGRLPLTFYKSTSDLPDFSDYDMENRTYKFFKGNPLYPFGFGLSYTNFSYDNLLIPDQIESNEKLKITVDVENTGDMAGDEVVQVYVRDVSASVRVPKHSLQAFERISLQPGEKRTISFELSPKNLALLNKDLKWMVEPGEFIISVGGGQPDFDAKTSEVLTTTLVISGENFMLDEMYPAD